MTHIEFYRQLFDLLWFSFEEGTITIGQFYLTWDTVVPFNLTPDLTIHEWASLRKLEWPPHTFLDDYKFGCVIHNWISDNLPCPTCMRNKIWEE